MRISDASALVLNSVHDRDRRLLREILQRYAELWTAYKARLDAFLQQVERARAEGVDVSPAWLFQQARYNELINDIALAINDLVRDVGNVIEDAQREAVMAAQEHAEMLVKAGLPSPEPGVSVSFARVPHEALAHLIGVTGAGMPLTDLLAPLGEQAINGVRDGLIRGLALGQNPRVVARQIRDALGGNMVRAMRIARTEMLRSYRSAQYVSYLNNSDVVKGWAWHSALGRRTCMSCIALHGRQFPPSARMDTHVNCRCVMVPITYTWRELGFKRVKEESAPEVETAERWFMLLPYSEKIKRMPILHYEALRRGMIRWVDLVAWRHNPVWGRSPRLAPLEDFVLPKAREALRLSAAQWKEHRSNPRLYELYEFADKARWLLLDGIMRRAARIGYNEENIWLSAHTIDAWDGIIRFVSSLDKPGAVGQALWFNETTRGRTISIIPDLNASVWRGVNKGYPLEMVILHEMLHTLSYCHPNDYIKIPGAEEGVVEQLTHIFLPEVIRGVYGSVDMDKVKQTCHSYAVYVGTLEAIREEIKMDLEEFYIRLMVTPLGRREEMLRQLYKERVGDAIPPQYITRLRGEG